jgi:hypothetical protein
MSKSEWLEIRLVLNHLQFKRCIAYNYPGRNQEGQNIDIHEIRGPGRGLMFTDTGNDGNILACIGSVRKAISFSTKKNQSKWTLIEQYKQSKMHITKM